MERDTVTNEEVARAAAVLLEAGNEMESRLVRLLGATGLRLREALKLKRADVTEGRTGYFLVVRTGKESRMVPLQASSVPLLGTRKGTLFPISYGAAVSVVRHALVTVGVERERARAHAIRKGWIIRALQSGTPPAWISDVSSAPLRAVVSAMGDALRG